MITLELPFPPSLNHYKRIGRTIVTKAGKSYQQRYNSPETKAYYYEVWQRVMKLRREGFKSFGSAMISVYLGVYPKNKRKFDLDNLCKVLLDSLQKSGLFDDDSQIHLLTVEKKSIIPEGKVIVRIEELTC